MEFGNAVTLIAVFAVVIIGAQMIFGRKRRSGDGSGDGGSGYDSDGVSDGGGDGGGGGD